jgi:uracil-DNA glycosylase
VGKCAATTNTVATIAFTGKERDMSIGKVLIIGQQPVTPTSKAFENAKCKKKLLKWLESMGVTEYELANQSDLDIYEKITNFDGKIITLGKIAEKRIKSMDVYAWPLPHPSGLNRKLNDKDYEDHVILDCARWLRGETKAPDQFVRY